jgi:omega-6 fatty acid desaturase (delta-12 desaturase)
MATATTTATAPVRALTNLDAPKTEEYNEDHLPAYTPMPWTLKQIRDNIPPHLFVRDTVRGLLYLARDILMAAILWSLATYIDPYARRPEVAAKITPYGAEALRWAGWLT